MLFRSQLAYNDGHRPTDIDLDAIAAHYGNHSALLGYHLYDEPGAGLTTRLETVQNRLKQQDPAHMTFVNFMPTYAAPARWGFTDVSGDFVRANRVLGQSFRTGSNQTSLSTLLWIDRSQWGAGESLTLKLWNLPSKQTLIAQSTLASAADNWPVFTLNAAVSPSTDYY